MPMTLSGWQSIDSGATANNGWTIWLARPDDTSLSLQTSIHVFRSCTKTHMAYAQLGVAFVAAQGNACLESCGT
jgi:hypothetical protein